MGIYRMEAPQDRRRRPQTYLDTQKGPRPLESQARPIVSHEENIDA